jgi:ABC-type lipoprotein release transport system permease subunit
MILSSAAALFTSLAAALFPAVHAARIRPADALRHY